MSLEAGQLIENKYRIVGLIGEGGMGAVYLGENVRIQRKVAIKVLHGAFSGNADVVQRFEREAQAAGRIGNDHILEVLDLGQFSNGDHFMVMEYLEGETLSARIKRSGRLLPGQVAPVARQILAGLAAAHGAGIVHRDLKPENIFILREKAGKADYVKIIDFGISKFQPLTNDGMRMTRTGAVMGTPYYMSPEQASGSREADGRSDLYSVGVMLYEAMTGRVPFDAPTFNQLLFQIVLSEPPPAQQVVPDLDPAFASIISKGMARDVEHRFQSAGEFIAAIDAWSAHGAGVTIPPPIGAQGAMAPIPAQPGVPLGSGTNPGIAGQGHATSGSWATSQSDVVPKKSAAPVIAVAAGVGLLMLGGAALAAFAIFGKDDVQTTPAATSETTSAPIATPATDPKAEPIPPPESKPPEQAAPTTSAAPSEQASPAKTAASRPVAKGGPTKPPAPAKPPPAKPPEKKSGTQPDFGY
jgi:eukaryotic-like serine/threonine-protein kinase